jgi:hypothetical protein
MAFGYLIAIQAPSSMLVMARRILGSIRTVTENRAPARRQAATNAPA